MINVVARDFFCFILWSFARFTPFFLWFSFISSWSNLTADEAIGGILLFGGLTWIWIFGLYGTTNTVPALLWRYKSRHRLRTIALDGATYKQINLYGVWLFISHEGDQEVPRTAFFRWSSEYAWRESCFKDQRFKEFLNAHRDYQTVNVTNPELYVKGEKV